MVVSFVVFVVVLPVADCCILFFMEQGRTRVLPKDGSGVFCGLPDKDP